MYLNEMELKFYYEMKKEEMEKAISANRFSKNNQKPKFYMNFFKDFNQNKPQDIYAVQKPICCNINTQEVCC